MQFMCMTIEADLNCVLTQKMFNCIDRLSARQVWSDSWPNVKTRLSRPLGTTGWFIWSVTDRRTQTQGSCLILFNVNCDPTICINPAWSAYCFTSVPRVIYSWAPLTSPSHIAPRCNPIHIIWRGKATQQQTNDHSGFNAGFRYPAVPLSY